MAEELASQTNADADDVREGLLPFVADLVQHGLLRVDGRVHSPGG